MDKYKIIDNKAEEVRARVRRGLINRFGEEDGQALWEKTVEFHKAIGMSLFDIAGRTDKHAIYLEALSYAVWEMAQGWMECREEIRNDA